MSVPFYYNQPNNNSVRTPQLPFVLPQQQQQQQQQQMAFRNQNMMDPNRRRSHNKIIRPDGTIEEVEETEDDISARDISTARYKRNHDYLSEIFNSYTTNKNTSVTNGPIEIEQTKEELDQLSEEYVKSFQEQQQKYSEKLNQIEKENQQFWELMNKLNDASTLESIDSASNELVASMGLKVKFTSEQVDQISIPEAMLATMPESMPESMPEAMPEAMEVEH